MSETSPRNVPWWMVAVGAFVAIVIGVGVALVVTRDDDSGTASGETTELVLEPLGNRRRRSVHEIGSDRRSRRAHRRVRTRRPVPTRNSPSPEASPVSTAARRTTPRATRPHSSVPRRATPTRRRHGPACWGSPPPASATTWPGSLPCCCAPTPASPTTASPTASPPRASRCCRRAPRCSSTTSACRVCAARAAIPSPNLRPCPSQLPAATDSARRHPRRPDLAAVEPRDRRRRERHRRGEPVRRVRHRERDRVHPARRLGRSNPSTARSS